MDAFEKWKPVNGYGVSSLDAIAEQAFRAGMRAAAEICRKGVGALKADGFHVAAYEVTERIADILAEADK
jgi:hypothetical protein